jgi:hypothetical protein
MNDLLNFWHILLKISTPIFYTFQNFTSYSVYPNFQIQKFAHLSKFRSLLYFIQIPKIYHSKFHSLLFLCKIPKFKMSTQHFNFDHIRTNVKFRCIPFEIPKFAILVQNSNTSTNSQPPQPHKLAKQLHKLTTLNPPSPTTIKCQPHSEPKKKHSIELTTCDVDF